MFLLFDIGGTTTRLAISHTGDKIDDVKLFPTNHDFSQAMEEMRRISVEFSKGEKFHAVIGGVRSYDRKSGTLFNQPHYPLWVGEPILKRMKEMWGDVYLENDAALIALGEAVYGSGKDNEIVAYVTLSTGVGGCRVTNGRIDKATYSFEPGNMLIPWRGEELQCLEKLVSGSAIHEKYGVLPSQLEDENAWDEIIQILAIGLNNVAVMWSPDVIILGGSVPQKLDFEKVNEYFKKVCSIYPNVPPVIKDNLDEEGGLYGGLAYLKNLP